MATVALLALGALGFAWIRHVGEALEAPSSSSSVGMVAGAAVALPQQQHALLHVLLALVVIIAVARGTGALFRRIGQPPVIGEVVAGLLLGPSLLGRVAPSVSAYVLPVEIAPLLAVLSQIGVILYMFLVGLEFDSASLRRHGSAIVTVAQASIVVPFLGGAGLALFIYPVYSTRDVPFGVFALFVGVSLSVTAFPVLARILTDRGIARSHVGMLALACAAANDAAAWCLLAIVAGVASAHFESAIYTVALTILYAAFMLIAGPPLARRFFHEGAPPPGSAQESALPQSTVAIVFVLLLVSALVTEYIGIHAMFGAFLLGAIIPHEGRLAAGMRARLDDVVGVLLLPAFFAFTGLRTQIGLVSGAHQWMVCGIVIGVAIVGKIAGTAIAARMTGLGWQESSALGVLMNTRGLMELIVLNLGLDLHIVSPTVFAMMVLMALLTTMVTGPALRLVTRGHPDFTRPAQ